MTPPSHTEPRDFRTYLRSLWRWKFLVLGLLVVVPAISYMLESRKVPQYQSSALVRPQAEAGDSALSAAAPADGDSIFAVARLVQTRTIAAAAGRLMSPPEPGSAISGLVSVSPDTETEFLTISATAPDPQRAADVANAYAQAISANRTSTRVGQLDRAIKGFRRQLEALPADPQGAAPDPRRAQLNEQIANLRSARNTLRPDQGIIETAIASSVPVGRGTRRAIALGMVIALLLSAGAIAVAESSDRRIRDPEDLERLTGLPLLAAIPGSAFGSDIDEERDEEAFQMLRAALTYFNLDQSLTSVVIASAGQEDGKTTVAVRLAYAMARSGSHVILVDADMRHPRIATRLGLPLTEGLGSVLVGARDLGEALISMPIRLQDGPDMGAHGSLKLLPAGVAAPNAAELLSSPTLKAVVLSLEQRTDMVIVDSAAALAVSDTLPLLQLASGVVLVARMNRSTRAEVRRLQQVTTAARGTILGVVATGASDRGGSGYGYGYAPAPKPHWWRPTRRSSDRMEAEQPPTRSRSRSGPSAAERAAERETARPASPPNGSKPSVETPVPDGPVPDGPRRTASDPDPQTQAQRPDAGSGDRRPEPQTRSVPPRGDGFDDLFES